MRDEHIHVSDEELLAFVDGELAKSRSTHVREHLTFCWTCRRRVTQIEKTINGFVEAHRANLDSQTSPSSGSRALLKARLAEAANAQQAHRQSAFSGWRVGYAFAAALLIIVIGMGLWRNRVTSRETSINLAPYTSEPIPNRKLTPGAVRPVSLADVCSLGHSDKNRPVPTHVQQEVFEKYGIKGARSADYEVDYLITPELGGSDDVQNLWPEPYSSAWSAYVKDALEDRLHELVCDRQIDLSTAQHDISTDWISAYKKYFHTDKPRFEHTAVALGMSESSPMRN
jgi:hypothetical protein